MATNSKLPEEMADTDPENSVHSVQDTGEMTEDGGIPAAGPVNEAYFEIAELNRDWFWVLTTKNGRHLAMSTQPYKRKVDCLQAVKALKKMDLADLRILHATRSQH